MSHRSTQVALAIASLALLSHPEATAEEWPSFRGPGAGGVAHDQGLPTEWDTKSGRNVLFKTAVPGLGHSSPVVWGDRVFLTTAVGGRDESLAKGDEGGIDLVGDATPLSWRLLSLSATDGRILWQTEAFSGPPRAKRHVKGSQANATPATDGRTVVAIFGPAGLAAFDWSGMLR